MAGEPIDLQKAPAVKLIEFYCNATNSITDIAKGPKGELKDHGEWRRKVKLC